MEMIATKKTNSTSKHKKRNTSQKLDDDARQKANKNGEPQEMTAASTNQIRGNLRATSMPL